MPATVTAVEEQEDDATMDLSSMSMIENLSKAIAIEVDKVNYGRKATHLHFLQHCRDTQVRASGADELAKTSLLELNNLGADSPDDPFMDAAAADEWYQVRLAAVKASMLSV